MLSYEMYKDLRKTSEDREETKKEDQRTGKKTTKVEHRRFTLERE